MKQQDVFNKIGGIIREINEQYAYLAGGQDQLNDLELELLKANAHFLSDHIEVLRKIIAQQAARQPETVPLPPPVAEKPVAAPQPPAPAPAAPVVIEEPVTLAPMPEPVDPPKSEPEPEPEEPQQPEPGRKPEPKYFEPMVERVAVYASGPTVEPAETEPRVVEFDMPKQQVVQAEQEETPAEPEAKQEEEEVIRHELTIDEADQDWDEEEGDAPEQEPAEEPAPEPEPVAEVPVVKEEPKPEPARPVVPEIPKPAVPDEVITFNQKISAQMGASSRMSDHLSGQTISDLKAAISLNDKLMYVKDLFNGYSLAYSEALEILNTRFRSFEEAENFLKPYAAKNNWADKTATADKFYSLLRRRYAA